MSIEFTVEGRPPKKHGEKSMWARDDEAPLIRLLREKAFEARTKAGFKRCFSSLVGLDITVFVPKHRLESVGDLDSFVANMCDGSQAADRGVKPHGVFSNRKNIDPRFPLLIENDRKVTAITARKTVATTGRLHYRVVVAQLVGANST